MEECSMLKTFVFSALLLFGCAQGTRAADAPLQLPLCPNWSQNVETDLALWQAIEAAYPSAKVNAENEEVSRRSCLFPYKLLRYDQFAVLMTLSGEPGEACHGCGARVSAVFLQRDGVALTITGRHDGFTEAGTLGDLMAIDPVRIGSQDALIVEGGGTFQGYSSSALSLFLIRSGRMEPLGPEDGISSGNSNCGVRDGPCRSVSGSWYAEGRRFVVRYLGRRANGTSIKGAVAYELRKGSLVLISGHKLALEMEKGRP
jgi:hypothetical protein